MAHLFLIWGNSVGTVYMATIIWVKTNSEIVQMRGKDWEAVECQW